MMSPDETERVNTIIQELNALHKHVGHLNETIRWMRDPWWMRAILWFRPCPMPEYRVREIRLLPFDPIEPRLHAFLTVTEEPTRKKKLVSADGFTEDEDIA